MTSAISTFFAFTSRHHDENSSPAAAVLMGKSILLNHHVDDQGFEPDGWCAAIEDEAPLPISDPELIERFCEDWGLARRNGDTGTSIVIPFVRIEVDLETLGTAVVSEYPSRLVSLPYRL